MKNRPFAVPVRPGSALRVLGALGVLGGLAVASHHAGWYQSPVAEDEDPVVTAAVAQEESTLLPPPETGRVVPPPPSSSQRPKAVKVNCSVVQSGAPTDELWYFDGADANQFSERVTLTAMDGRFQVVTPIRWDVVRGRGKVSFPNGIDTIITSGNSVDLLSTGASAAAAEITKDIEIRMTDANGLTCHFPLVVFAPDHLVLLLEEQIPGPNGYITETTYRTEHQFNQPLPRLIELNSDFGPEVSDFPGENWPWRPETAVFVSPFSWIDTIDRDAPVFTVPPALNPMIPLGSVKVDHRDGSWKHGSLNASPGPDNNDGRIVRNLRWQIYQDHASHE